MKIISKEEAFAPKDSDVDIPIKTIPGHDFLFTRKWFRSRNQVTWGTYLKPMFEVHLKSSTPIAAIQTGIFEGMDVVWLMQNVLTDPNSTFVGVDPWEATTKLDASYMKDCRDRAEHNLKPWKNRVALRKGYSKDILPLYPDGLYDLIVIDGDHNAPAVFIDAVEGLRLLRKGGVMVFDDVRNRVEKEDHVLDGIRMFLEKHEKDVQLAWQHRYVDCFVKV